MVVFFVCFTYVCICQIHLRHVHHRRNPLCNGRRRRRQCCKCTWGTRPTLGYSCPQHWGRCCYCSCRHGMPWLDHFHQEGSQRSHHHIVHTSYLENVKVGVDRVLYNLLYWISKQIECSEPVPVVPVGQFVQTTSLVLGTTAHVAPAGQGQGLQSEDEPTVESP